jgi:hypothetical protein
MQAAPGKDERENVSRRRNPLPILPADADCEIYFIHGQAVFTGCARICVARHVYANPAGFLKANRQTGVGSFTGHGQKRERLTP